MLSSEQHQNFKHNGREDVQIRGAFITEEGLDQSNTSSHSWYITLQRIDVGTMAIPGSASPCQRVLRQDT